MILTIIQACIFIAYLNFIIYKFGVIPSISESWYELQKLGGVWYSLFTLFCYALGITLFFQTNGSTGLFFLAGAGLVFVGVATQFKLDHNLEPYIHFTGAAICILSSLLALGFERHMWLPGMYFIILSGFISLMRFKNATWWIEITAFACIIVGLLIS